MNVASPFICAPRPQVGRVQTLLLIEAELQERIDWIECRFGWTGDDRLSAMHIAFTRAIKIVQDHHHFTADGKPLRT